MDHSVLKNTEKWTQLGFLENSSQDFANIANLNETNDTLSNESGPMFLKNLNCELWSDS